MLPAALTTTASPSFSVCGALALATGGRFTSSTVTFTVPVVVAMPSLTATVKLKVRPARGTSGAEKVGFAIVVLLKDTPCPAGCVHEYVSASPSASVAAAFSCTSVRSLAWKSAIARTGGRFTLVTVRLRAAMLLNAVPSKAVTPICTVAPVAVTSGVVNCTWLLVEPAWLSVTAGPLVCEKKYCSGASPSASVAVTVRVRLVRSGIEPGLVIAVTTGLRFDTPAAHLFGKSAANGRLARPLTVTLSTSQPLARPLESLPARNRMRTNLPA